MLGCPNDQSKKNTTSEPEQKHPSNDYFKVELDPRTNENKFFITKNVSNPILIKKDGEALLNQKISSSKADEFEKAVALLLPMNHWFAKHFLQNPFKEIANFALARPFIWGYEFELKATDKNTALFIKGEKRNEANPLPKVTMATLKKIFGDDFNDNVIAEEGKGKVYDVKYLGNSFALKENAQEFFDLQQLFFTTSTIKSYAYFKSGDKQFAILEKGKADLAQLNEEGVKLSDDILRDAIKRFKTYINAASILNIKNNDIKPQNIILLKDDTLRIIDIDSSFTKGYYGTDGQLLARALLSNKLQTSFRFGHVSLDLDKEYREGLIAPPYLFRLWHKALCYKTIKDKSLCSNIDSFKSYFSLLEPKDLYDIGVRFNKRHTGSPGTVDREHFPRGPYETGLPLPNLYSASDINWHDYYQNKDIIGEEYCRIGNQLEGANFGRENIFFDDEMWEEYQYFCQPEEDGYQFIYPFDDHNDEDFHNWIRAAYKHYVMLNTFEQLAYEYPIDSAMPLVFQENFDLSDKDGIGTALYNLYNYKAPLK